jgi:hypothetical protein
LWRLPLVLGSSCRLADEDTLFFFAGWRGVFFISGNLTVFDFEADLEEDSDALGVVAAGTPIRVWAVLAAGLRSDREDPISVC